MPHRKLRKKADAFPGQERVFYCNIAFLREQRGFSLRDIEKHSGLNRSTLCRAEAGLAIELSTALKLARFFKTTVEKLWTLKSENGKAKK